MVAILNLNDLDPVNSGSELSSRIVVEVRRGRESFDIRVSEFLNQGRGERDRLGDASWKTLGGGAMNLNKNQEKPVNRIFLFHMYHNLSTMFASANS